MSTTNKLKNNEEHAGDEVVQTIDRITATWDYQQVELEALAMLPVEELQRLETTLDEYVQGDAYACQQDGYCQYPNMLLTGKLTEYARDPETDRHKTLQMVEDVKAYREACQIESDVTSLKMDGTNMLAVYMVRDPEFMKRAVPKIKTEHFGQEHRALLLVWASTHHHYEDTGKLPNKAELDNSMRVRHELNPDLFCPSTLAQARKLVQYAYDYDSEQMDGIEAEYALLDPWMAQHARQLIREFSQTDNYEGLSTIGLAGRLEDLLDSVRVSQAGGGVFELQRASEIKAEAVEWLWPSRFAKGMIHLLVGEAGVSKSFLTCDMAARITKGLPWPDQPDTARPPGDVVIVSAEDSSKLTIVPRLEAAGADMDRVFIHNVEKADELLEIKQHIKVIRSQLKLLPNPVMLVFDPITAYYGEKVDSHKNAEIRAAMRPLMELADSLSIAVVGISHLNKSLGHNAKDRVSGSHGQVALARFVWMVTEDKEDRERKIMTLTKCNLSKDIGGLAYRLSDKGYGSQGMPRIEWEQDAVFISSNDALYDKKDKTSKVDMAVEFLYRFLGAKGEEGAVAAEVEMIGSLNSPALRKRTLDRAKGALGVESVKQGKGWIWRLPPRQLEEYRKEQEEKQAHMTSFAEMNKERAPELSGKNKVMRDKMTAVYEKKTEECKRRQ